MEWVLSLYNHNNTLVERMQVGFDKSLCQVFVGIFSVSVIHEEKFASRAPLLLTNAQKYRHAKYACLILACLYALVPNLFFVNYWNLEKMNNEYLTTNLSF